MNYLRVHAMLEEMIKAILNEQPGFAKVGNVWMEWDGEVLTWDIPLSEWDVEDVWQSLRERAKNTLMLTVLQAVPIASQNYSPYL